MFQRKTPKVIFKIWIFSEIPDYLMGLQNSEIMFIFEFFSILAPIIIVHFQNITKNRRVFSDFQLFSAHILGRIAWLWVTCFKKLILAHLAHFEIWKVQIFVNNSLTTQNLRFLQDFQNSNIFCWKISEFSFGNPESPLFPGKNLKISWFWREKTLGSLFCVLCSLFEGLTSWFWQEKCFGSLFCVLRSLFEGLTTIASILEDYVVELTNLGHKRLDLT